MTRIPVRTQLTIVVNGNQTEITEGSGISDLIRALGLNTERVAVELNKKIVRRADWASTTFSEGDKVEIVHFVGGGEGKLGSADCPVCARRRLDTPRYFHRNKKCQIH